MCVNREAWFSRYHPAPPGSEPRRLVCFPHAGGSASFYLPVSSALQPDVEVIGVQYPGRQERRTEQPVQDLHDLADLAAEALAPMVDRRTAFFGHSMGAVVAYEVALRLKRNHGVEPTRLFVSGRRAPSAHRPLPDPVHRRDDAGIVAELRRLAGTHADLLADDEIVRMIMPAVRGDYRAIETYAPRPAPPLECPVTAFVGDRDPQVEIAEAEAWAGHTAGPFDIEVFPGGHFYLVAEGPAVIAGLRDRLGVPV
ncbi:thioesterase II family protein [Streptomyces sp. NPDC088197]|uniref:thioesterase II family protein n=1 Tax=unclassified Streptomyces TaxID=2593676 RepID=UPI0036E4A6FA